MREEQKIPEKLDIVQFPFRRTFKLDSRLHFYGLLCRCYFSDGTVEFVTDPWLEPEQGELPGTYKCRVFLDSEHSYGLTTDFKFYVEPSGSEFDVFNKNNK